MAYRTNLNSLDKSGAIAGVVAVHAALLVLLLNISGKIPIPEVQRALKMFDVTHPSPPPPPTPPPPQQREAARPKQNEGAAAPRNVKSEATPIKQEEPRIALPLPVPVATSPTPRTGTQVAQGASTPGPGTGAGGAGAGTGSGAGGNGPGGGGAGDVIAPPHLITPTLTGRDFPRDLLQQWPRGAQVFVRLKVDASGNVSDCLIDRGTDVATIDSAICSLIEQRFRYRPATNRAGQAVAGWAGYRQVAPQ